MQTPHPFDILLTGANGRLGSALGKGLRNLHGGHRVLATDLRAPQAPSTDEPFRLLDVLQQGEVENLIGQCRPNTIYHLAGCLPVVSDQLADRSWEVNTRGLIHVSEAARKIDARVFWPGSIAAGYRGAAPSLYALSKKSGEECCAYYAAAHGLDIRSLRLPAVLSVRRQAEGRTLDYVTDMCRAAMNSRSYTCYLRPDTQSPALYIDDAVRAIQLLMSAPTLTGFNLLGVSAVTVSPAAVASQLSRQFPKFKVYYVPDKRQQIADGWPDREDCPLLEGFTPEYQLADLLDELVHELYRQLPVLYK